MTQVQFSDSASRWVEYVVGSLLLSKGFSPGQPEVSVTFEIVVQVSHCRMQFDKFLVNIHRIFSDNIMGLKLLIVAQISVLIYNYNVAMANFSTVPKCHLVSVICLPRY